MLLETKFSYIYVLINNTHTCEAGGHTLIPECMLQYVVLKK